MKRNSVSSFLVALLLSGIIVLSGCTSEREPEPEIGNFSVSQERSNNFVYTYDCKRDKSSLKCEGEIQTSSQYIGSYVVMWAEKESYRCTLCSDSHDFVVSESTGKSIYSLSCDIPESEMKTGLKINLAIGGGIRVFPASCNSG